MKKELIILFRKGIGERDEYEIACKYFKTVTCRTECKNNLVISRYSCLPFYRELEKDLEYNDCYLINSHHEHCWIADFGYYYELMDYTPKSWNEDNFWSCKDNGPFVVKGKTNSKKHKWKTQMFANTKEDAIRIGNELREDNLISEQGIIYRKYEPLTILGVDDICGIPNSNEWRFFYYRDIKIAHGYYWSSASPEVIAKAKINEKGLEFANKIAKIASEFATFFVLDIAEKENKEWILIEMNDAQMSGLSEILPDDFYRNLSKVL